MTEIEASTQNSAHAPPDQPAEPRCSRATALLAIGGMLLVLYVLSAPPMLGFTGKANVLRKQARAFYAPVIWLHKSTPLRKPLEWYARMLGWTD